MPTTTSSIHHYFNLYETRIISTPTPYTAFGALDEHGIPLSLKRLKNESDYEYKIRLEEVYSRRANSAYLGLIYGITRELGLSVYDGIWVNPKLRNGAFIAPDPYVKFDGVYVYLYSDYRNGTLDCTLDRYDAGGFEVYSRLVSRINQSAYFEAGVCPEVDQWTSSMTIVNQDNRKWIDVEDVPQSNRFRIRRWLCPGTVYFEDRVVFKEEKDTAGEVDSAGDYYIDYTTGIVDVYSIPVLNTTVRYCYTVFPFNALASPVILHDVTNDNFRVKMFEQILQDDGTYEHGETTMVGADIINELVSVFPGYWGE